MLLLDVLYNSAKVSYHTVYSPRSVSSLLPPSIEHGVEGGKLSLQPPHIECSNARTVELVTNNGEVVNIKLISINRDLS